MEVKMSDVVIRVDGHVISLEDSNGVPDVTKDTGPDQIKLQENVKKPTTDENAEYDAAENVDNPEDIKKANESTFLGVIFKNRSIEAFAKAKGVFPNADAFFKSNECKGSVAAAKSWAEKHKVSLASSSDIPEKYKGLGFSNKVISGAVLVYLSKKDRLYVDILFKNAKGKVTSKRFATVKIGKGGETSSDSTTPVQSGQTKTQSNVDAVIKKKGSESDNPVDNAFDETAAGDPPPVETAPAPAPAETAADPAEAASTTEEPSEASVASEITSDEIDEESKTTESYLESMKRLVKSREEADAAAAKLDDSEIDEVVGDSEGSGVEDTDEGEGSGGEGGSEGEGGDGSTKPEGDEPSDEEKAMESFFAELNK
jgi:hypothetical protein